MAKPKPPSNLDNNTNLVSQNLSSQVPKPANYPQRKAIQPIQVEKKIGRNESCPCGSGKKYKKCHGN